MLRAVILAGSIGLLWQNSPAAKPQFNKTLEKRFMTACVSIVAPDENGRRPYTSVLQLLGKYYGTAKWDKGFGETPSAYMFQAVQRDAFTGNTIFLRYEFEKNRERRTEENCGPESVSLNRVLLRNGDKQIVGNAWEAIQMLLLPY